MPDSLSSHHEPQNIHEEAPKKLKLVLRLHDNIKGFRMTSLDNTLKEIKGVAILRISPDIVDGIINVLEDPVNHGRRERNS